MGVTLTCLHWHQYMDTEIGARVCVCVCVCVEVVEEMISGEGGESRILSSTPLMQRILARVACGREKRGREPHRKVAVLGENSRYKGRLHHLAG